MAHRVAFDHPLARLVQGDAVEVLAGLPDASVDAVVVDPPYSSGGIHKSDRSRSPSAKYEHSAVKEKRDGFEGDNRDQRSWFRWCNLWLSECYRVARPGAYLFMFSDWRQLPTATDAIQAAEWLWRGVAAWDKGLGSRAPHKGYLRHQCEFVAWGSKGPIATDADGGPFPGCFRHPVRRSDKHHLTGKPTPLMREIARIVPAGSLILDPFAGSSTTGVGALLEGRRFLGVEKRPANVSTSRRRLAEAAGVLGRVAA